MISAIELENFKAFGDRTRIELAPITLVFGENSAGKSTIIQSLNLLKQSRERGLAFLPRIEGGIVDLGDYAEMVFDHEIDRDMTFRVEFQPEGISTTRSPKQDGHRGASAASHAYEMSFSRSAANSSVTLTSLRLMSGVEECISEFRLFECSEAQMLSSLKHTRNLLSAAENGRRPTLLAAKCSNLSRSSVLWEQFYSRTKRRAERIASELEELQSAVFDSSSSRSIEFDFAADKQAALATIQTAIRFYQSDFTINQYIDRMEVAELATVVALNGFVPFASWRLPITGLPELETFRRYGPGNLRLRELTPCIGSLAVDFGRRLDRVLDLLYPMGPFRKPPERWYFSSGANPRDVGYRGDLLPDLLHSNDPLLRSVNGWLRRLEIGYELKTESIKRQDLFELRLVDLRRDNGVGIALADVGFGISQILPFIVQSLASRGQLITIEQPEVHIHPRLQADLGDLLSETSRPPHCNRYIIETHSEHLVLRMQRLIRRGVLTPEDVSILYVRRSAKGSTVERLRIDEEGDFIDDWPGGFFPERLRELM